MDVAATGGVCRLHDPDIPLGLGLLELLVVSVEVMELVREDVSVWDEVELTSAKSLLHLDIVETKSVLSGDFITLWEMIDSLEFVQTFIQVALAGRARPEDVPLMGIGEVEVIGLKKGPNKLRIALQELVEHLGVVDVVASLRLHRWWCIMEQLVLGDCFDVDLLVESLERGAKEVVRWI